MKTAHFFSAICLIIICSLFCSCQYNPKTMIPMTPQEICDYMNKNFKGDFELINEDIDDTTDVKVNTAYMKCSLFPEKTVVTSHGWYDDHHFGWRKHEQTNYNSLYFQNDIEKTYNELIENWFETFDYKFAYKNEDRMEDLKVFSSYQNYLNSKPYFNINVAVNTSTKETKDFVIQKVKAIAYDVTNSINYEIHLNLFLWENQETFD